MEQPQRFFRIPGTAQRYLDALTGEEISRREYEKRRGRPLPPPHETADQARSRAEGSAILSRRGVLWVKGKAQRVTIAAGAFRQWQLSQIPNDGTYLPPEVEMAAEHNGDGITLTEAGFEVHALRYEWQDSPPECVASGWAYHMNELLTRNGEEPLFELEQRSIRGQKRDECIIKRFNREAAERWAKRIGIYTRY